MIKKELLTQKNIFEKKELMNFKDYLGVVNQYIIDNFDKNTSSTIEAGENPPFSTKMLNHYNIFLFPNQHIHKLYMSVKEIIDNKNENKNRYYIRGWLNYYNRGQYLDWHQHWCIDRRSYHGFFCVDVENSYTCYRYKDGENVFVNCENGMLVLEKTYNNVHRTSDWFHETPRITVAFDIHPLDVVLSKQDQINYWNPI